MNKDTYGSVSLTHKKMLEVEEIFWGSITSLHLSKGGRA